MSFTAYSQPARLVVRENTALSYNRVSNKQQRRCFVTGPNLDDLTVSKYKQRTVILFECHDRMTPAIQLCLCLKVRRGDEPKIWFALIYFILSTALRMKWIWTSTPTARKFKLRFCSKWCSFMQFCFYTAVMSIIKSKRNVYMESNSKKHYKTHFLSMSRTKRRLEVGYCASEL